MKIYCTVNEETGAADGFWNDVDHTPDEIPDNAVEISIDDWIDYCQNQGKKSFKKTGELTNSPPIPPKPTLISLQFEQEIKLMEVRKYIDEAIDRDKPTKSLTDYRKKVRLALDNITDPGLVTWPNKPWETQ